MKTIRKVFPVTFILSLILALVGFLSCNTIFSKNLNFETQNKQVQSLDGLDTVLKLQNVYREIAKSLTPAVVSINVESEQIVRNPYNDFFNDPFFRRFFGEENMGPKEFKRKLQAMGSGFIVTKDGYLFSNYHVVKDATKIVVILADKRQFTAKVIGSDPETDIALLKINANNLPIVPLGDSGEAQVGDMVVAIGNPFGLSGTYTKGIISATGRPGMTGFQKFIQTDAPVNPGNSGGPLVNIKGQVIGINTAIQSQTGGYQGISFAVPVNTAKNVASQILGQGKIERGYIGINIAALDSTTRKLFGLSENEGVMVSKVEKDGPAEKAGIKKGDIITSIDGESVNSPDDLQAEIGSMQPGKIVKTEIYRDKKKLTVNVKLSERPGNIVTKSESNNDQDQPKETFEYLGAVFIDASKAILEQNGTDHGVLVREIKQDSPLSDILENGSIISSINDTDIKSLGDLKNFANNNKNAKSLTFLIVKDGYMVYKGIER
jgi:serine protease Do